MQNHYRGHGISLVETGPRTILLTELQSGALLPTKLSALPGESWDDLVGRARQLVDLYLEGRDRAMTTAPLAVGARA